MKNKSKKTTEISDNEKLIAMRRKSFDKTFVSVESGEAYLFKMLTDKQILRCLYCFKQTFVRCDNKRKILCLSCGRKQSFTTGTFLEDTRRASTLEYLFLVTLLEEGLQFSASEFSRHSTVVYSTSLNMIKKCAYVIVQSFPCEDSVKLVHCSEIERAIARRSSETPAREHPKAEQQEPSPDETIPPKTITKQITIESTGEVFSYEFPEILERELAELTAQHLEIFATIAESPCYFDDLCARFKNEWSMDVAIKQSTLEVVGLVARKLDYLYRHPNSIPKAKAIGADLDPNLKRSILSFILEVFGGISQKASQLYIALHWICNDREYWSQGKLLDKILASPPVTDNDIRSYVSPQVLTVVNLKAPAVA